MARGKRRLGFTGVPRERGSGPWGDPLATISGAKGSVGRDGAHLGTNRTETSCWGRNGGARRGGRCGARGRVDAVMPQAPWHLSDVPGVEAPLLCGSSRAGVGPNGATSPAQRLCAAELCGSGDLGFGWRRGRVEGVGRLCGAN
jgi:hypothetical protein